MTGETALTDLEMRLLRATTKTEFGDAREDPVWVFSVFDAATMDPKIGRGVLSSLVQKGMVEVQEWEERGEQVVTVTKNGKAWLEERASA